MSISNRGFASLSKQRRKEVSKAGGKASSLSGRGYKWSKLNASDMAKKAAAKRKKTAAEQAALWLMEEFAIPAAKLFKLGLDYDGFIYYGGSRTTAKRIDELKQKIAELN